MFLLPSELGFLRYLKEAKVPLNEYSFPDNKISNVQSQVRQDLDFAILLLKGFSSSRNYFNKITRCIKLPVKATARTCRLTHRIH